MLLLERFAAGLVSTRTRKPSSFGSFPSMRRVHAFKNRGHAFQGHFSGDLLFADAELQLAGDRKIEKIGGADAVDRGHEGNGNTAADFVDFVEVLHDLDQAEHRADDSDGWSKTGRLTQIPAGNLLFVLRLIGRAPVPGSCAIPSGSVPSTASIRDFFRKGSSISFRLASSETMPFRDGLSGHIPPAAANGVLVIRLSAD